MATTLFTAWDDEVATELNGCPIDMVRVAVRNAAIAFCDHTRSWLYEHDDINILEDTPLLTYSPPENTAVAETLQAFYAPTNRELEYKGADELPHLHPNWKVWAGTPLYITSLDLSPNTVRLVPKPTVAVTGGFKNPLISLKPTRDATGLDSKLFDEYMEVIKLGAMARLRLIPKRPYTDLALGEKHQREFRSECNRVYNRVMRSLGRAHDITFVRG